MSPLTVVEQLDVLRDFSLCLLPRGILPMVHDLIFQRLTETLHWRVVIAISLWTHRRAYVELPQLLLIVLRTIWGPHGRSDGASLGVGASSPPLSRRRCSPGPSSSEPPLHTQPLPAAHAPDRVSTGADAARQSSHFAIPPAFGTTDSADSEHAALSLTRTGQLRFHKVRDGFF